MNPNVTGCDAFVRYLRWLRHIALVSLVWALAPPVGAQQKPDLSQMAIEDLMKIEVTSAAKKEQTLLQIPAAVYVVTQEEIRRSGATSIAEALRLAPGVEVAQVNSNSWAISIRGFNTWYANKLLVMIDGRSVYLPTFSGVTWDIQDVVLEDIERIEVIRGPGASLWGSNAVNGVINIITRSSVETEGGLLSSGGGAAERGWGVGRYGAPIGTKGHYRIFSKYLNRRSFVDFSGNNSQDAWDLIHGGFRSDWNLSGRDSLTVSGDVYSGSGNPSMGTFQLTPPYLQVLNTPTDVNGSNVLLRWQRTLAGDSRATLQMYYDRVHRASTFFGETQQTFDVDFQYRRSGKRHEVIGGVDFRLVSDRTRGSFNLALSPPQRTFRLFSGFVQDEVSLVPQRLKLTVGSKFESNNYSGVDVQPTVRLLWTLKPRHALWASVSRAVRTPSFTEREGRMNVAVLPGQNGVPTVLPLMGTPRFGSEDVLAYEAGYRAQPGSNVMVDVTGFYNIYRHLAGVAGTTPWVETDPAPVHVVLPMSFNNVFDARNYGVEIFASYSPLRAWKLGAGYTWLEGKLHVAPANAASSSPVQPGDNPVHQVQFRSLLSLPHAVEFDNFIYYVGRLKSQDVPGYTRWDIRLGWHPHHQLEFSVGAQNLLSGRHTEFKSTISLQGGAQISRTAYGRLTWHF